MTQEELDKLINSDNLDEFEIIEDEKHEIKIVRDLNDVNTESEEQGATITQTIEQIINEVDVVKLCLENKDNKKAGIILDDIKNMCFSIIELMQYQDIHRQKIERVMNKMIEIGNLSKDDLEKLSINIADSAKSIAENNVSDDELEKLLKEYQN